MLRTTSPDSKVRAFAATTYYDGQGFIVRKASGINSARDLDGATVCVATGTTTELNLADYFRTNNMKYKPVVIENVEEVSKTFFSGRCDALIADGSALAAERSKDKDPNKFIILPEVISKEPLGPAVRHGDDQWLDVVSWSIRAMINAEELGITSANVDSMMKSKDPNVQRLLGTSGAMGKGLGLDGKWAYNIIKSVGKEMRQIKDKEAHRHVFVSRRAPKSNVDPA